jgi:hypothetical protein
MAWALDRRATLFCHWFQPMTSTFRHGRGVIENNHSHAERSTTIFGVDVHTDTWTRFVVEYSRRSYEHVPSDRLW